MHFQGFAALRVGTLIRLGWVGHRGLASGTVWCEALDSRTKRWMQPNAQPATTREIRSVDNSINT